jgi:hypothetical protein
MTLTKPKAYQLYDIDYKQATRVVATTNIVLGGGAPLLVDGIVLKAKDRVLVTGQTVPSQNGLYIVQSAGIGLNGIWVRSQDAIATGQLLSGATVIVSEGNDYKDTQWVLTTDDPITIGVTDLAFVAFKSESFGTVNANGTVISSNVPGGQLNIIASDNINISGNPTTDTITISATYPIIPPTYSANYAAGDASDITPWVATIDNWVMYFNPITVGLNTEIELILATVVGTSSISGVVTWVLSSASNAFYYDGESVTTTGIIVNNSSWTSTDYGAFTFTFQDSSTSSVYRCTWMLGSNFIGSSLLIEKII